MPNLYFPTFEECPDENDADLDFYEPRHGFFLVPKRDWCLVAEIVDVMFFFRLRLWVKDSAGHEFPIAFHLEDDERRLDLTRFRKGLTIVIWHAEQHSFMDLSVGIRQESSRSFEVTA